MIDTANRRVGVFIDVQNMYYSARHLFQSKVHFSNIVNHGTDDGRLVRAIAYTISTEEGAEEAFFNALKSEGIEVTSKELLEYSGGNKKGDWDVGITIDIVRMLDMLDVVVLVSGDGDFVPLVNYCQARGRLVHVASFRESTSGSLVEACDMYTNLSEDKSTFLIGYRGKRKTTRKSSSSSASDEKKTTPKKTETKKTSSSKTSEKKTAKKPAAKRKSILSNPFGGKKTETVEEIEERRTRKLTF
jgi:uncharacterized LabA/DUF88 family protein